jgi:HPt (histidine-containing phosphotransfer) domain-containing protein
MQMSAKQRHALALRKTDIDGAIYRCCGSEDLYLSCLKEFLNDDTVRNLDMALAGRAWDTAFTAAHALKGLAGNMGFVPLMHAAGRLVVLIRGGRTEEVGAAMEEVNSCYRDITDAIMQLLSDAAVETEERP